MEQPRNHEQERVKPQVISPEEAALQHEALLREQREAIPQQVYDIVNRLITEKLRSGGAVVLQCDIVNALVEAGVEREAIFNNHWLDFEDSYRESGWKVFYDRPAYNESYEASFKFTIEGQRLGSAAIRKAIHYRSLTDDD